MNERKTRVGLVRMDTHTMYIGCIMEDHDPMLLRGPMPDRGRHTRTARQPLSNQQRTENQLR
ncbi:MAG TPA: hypothetical protein DIT01_03175 [Lentisphaeria bacterium]|nr:hypothetical protein [Lentisphaeria bacterium]